MLNFSTGKKNCMSGECGGGGGGCSPPEQGRRIAPGSGFGSGLAPSLPRAEGPLASPLSRGSPGVGLLPTPGPPCPAQRLGAHRGKRQGWCHAGRRAQGRAGTPTPARDPRSSQGPPLRPGSAWGCCTSGAGPRGSAPQSCSRPPPPAPRSRLQTSATKLIANCNKYNCWVWAKPRVAALGTWGELPFDTR